MSGGGSGSGNVILMVSAPAGTPVPDPNTRQFIPLMVDASGRLLGIGGGGGMGLGEFIFSDFGSQDEAQGRYTSWPDLFAKLATIQYGASPLVRLALSGPFSVPLAGMPATGWDMRGGRFSSMTGATGTQVLNCAAGVMFDNCAGIGDPSLGAGSVVMKIDPPPGTGVLNFTATPAGQPLIHVIGAGSGVDHSTNTGAYFLGPNTGAVCVLGFINSQQATGVFPALTGPLLELGATDLAVCATLGLPGAPNGWLAGGGPGSSLLALYDLNQNPDLETPGIWIPGFTGGGGVNYQTFGQSRFVQYPAPIGGPWAAPPPSTVAQALDRLALAVAGLLGGPIP